ncbi:hypothetical protein evm_008485 [Chilo suppressalis]|nr:hypothetical protein evm_008485 [Chilo suppressalis]
MEGKPQEVISEPQDIKPQPQVKQKSTTSLRNDIPAQFLPSHYMCNYPKGIPRSFLVKPSSQTPEPYSHFVNKNANPYQQNVQPNTSHLNWQTGNVPMETEPVWHPNTLSAAPAYGNMGNVEGNLGVQQPMFDQTFDEGENRQVYSPSDVYADNLASNSQNDIYNDMEPDSPEHNSGQKRQSAFDRLGPVSEPKKPKLTINLLFNKEQAVREVVDGATEETKVEKYVPVHLRKEIIDSTDETVVKFRDLWPWRRSVPVTKSVTARTSKMAMILEMEQMDEFYVRENLFFLISVKGYPPSWTKEKVLDVMLDTVKTKGFIPCFIEFTAEECKFLVIKCRPGIMVIHKNGFYIRKDDVEMVVTISVTATSLNHIEFIPRLILRKRLVLAYDGTNCLDLSNFTTKEDISHFLYYPLNQQINQIELMELQTSINWEKITELNLSHNRLTSIDGFNLAVTTPKLKHLDLSHNYLDNVMKLLQIRDLGLRSIKLDGNPLCINYIDPDQYVKVLKTMFSSLQEIDGIPIKFKGDMPPFKKNYCPEAAKPIIEKFLETYFPLLDSTDIESRAGVEELYHDRASMTITYRFKIRYGPIYRSFRSLFQRSRVIDEGDTESVDGAAVIADLIDKWPPLKHDPTTFSVDVIKHDDFMTIFKVAGIVKLTSESLADEEHLLAFTRTFVLHSYDGCEFKITNDMVYWDIPTNEYANNAFQITTTVKPMKLNLALESEPDDNLKENLMKIFMQLTDLGKEASERCLDLKNWNLKLALDYFIKLLKLDDLETLTKEGIS